MQQLLRYPINIDLEQQRRQGGAHLFPSTFSTERVIRQRNGKLAAARVVTLRYPTSFFREA